MVPLYKLWFPNFGFPLQTLAPKLSLYKLWFTFTNFCSPLQTLVSLYKLWFPFTNFGSHTLVPLYKLWLPNFGFPVQTLVPLYKPWFPFTNFGSPLNARHCDTAKRANNPVQVRLPWTLSPLAPAQTWGCRCTSSAASASSRGCCLCRSRTVASGSWSRPAASLRTPSPFWNRTSKAG